MNGHVSFKDFDVFLPAEIDVVCDIAGLTPPPFQSFFGD